APRTTTTTTGTPALPISPSCWPACAPTGSSTTATSTGSTCTSTPSCSVPGCSSKSSNASTATPVMASGTRRCGWPRTAGSAERRAEPGRAVLLGLPGLSRGSEVDGCHVLRAVPQVHRPLQPVADRFGRVQPNVLPDRRADQLSVLAGRGHRERRCVVLVEDRGALEVGVGGVHAGSLDRLQELLRIRSQCSGQGDRFTDGVVQRQYPVVDGQLQPGRCCACCVFAEPQRPV